MDYDAYGLAVRTSGTSVTPFRHKGGSGYRTDPDSGLMLLGMRYYDPSLGRFISRDPLGYTAGDVNLYRYAANNPVNASDPTRKYLETFADIAFFVWDAWEFFQKPTIPGAIGLVWDVVAILAPVPNISRAGEFLGVVWKKVNVGKTYRGKVKVPAPECFAGGTPVLMADGSKRRIEQMKAGDEVLTADQWSGEKGYRKVTRTFKREHDTLLTVRTQDGNRIEVTPEHPFWVEGKGFVAANRSLPSDRSDRYLLAHLRSA